LLAGLAAIPAIALCGAADALAPEPQTTIPMVATADVQGLEAVAPELARQVIASNPPIDPGADPLTRYRLDVVAGDYAAAERTLAELRPRFGFVPSPDDALALYEMVVAAMRTQAESHESFDAAFTSAFRRLYVPLDDKAASDVDYWIWVTYWLTRSTSLAQRQVEADLAGLKGKTAIPLQAAVSLLRDYQQYLEQRDTRPIVERLVAQDDDRRYLVSDDVLIRTRQGASLSAYVARPRGGPARQPAALFFTIYSDPTGNRVYAKYAAAHGYVGVVADARGKRLSRDEIRPWETEGEDADGVIDWISRQPWSDHQVGMFGGSYNGFPQWAALKHRPAALKTIVPYVPNLPGDGLPMEHNVFQTANYAWNFYVTDDRYLDETLYQNPARWNGLGFKWFASGRPYRQIDAIDGKPNPILQRQLNHPSYDAYWQAMAPYGREFAGIDIPILEISGYSGSDSVSDYFAPEDERYNPRAEHDLVIGPYDHGGSQSNFKLPVLGGYPIDPVAQLDTPALTFQWFDYVMKGGPKPALLKDRINFEVMGANVWRHAPSIARMSERTLELHPTGAPATDGRYLLSLTPPAKRGYVTQTVDLADRTPLNLFPPFRLSSRLTNQGGLVFVSDPLSLPLSVNGQISGEIKASINKRDMDFILAVYEVMPDGRYFSLAYYLGRASYAWDMSRRRLLTPGKIETIPFSRTGIISRQMSRGSRLLVVLSVNKNAFAQVNYGTGKDVSDESIADAKQPLEVRWYSDSVIRVPVSP
jgi:putative CocE/NonD family hydrolase